MDANRFDALAKGMATSTSRRSMLGALAAGSLLSALGLKQISSAAIGQTCTLDFTAMVRLGPSAGQVLASGATQPGELRGELSLPITVDGNIVDGAMRLADGTTLPVVGLQAGRSLEVRIEVEADQPLIAVGVGEETIADCRGAVDGLATGPQSGDLGDWHAVARGLTGEATGGGNPSTGSGTSATLTAVAATTTATAVATTTATVAPTPDATTMPTIPPGGCPPGQTADCGKECVDLLTNPSHCGACGNACGMNQGCTNGQCSDLVGPSICRAGLTNCDGNCVDIFADPANCGSCGRACSGGQVCVSGSCGCAAPLVLVGGRCCLSNAATCTADSDRCSGFCDPNSQMTCRTR